MAVAIDPRPTYFGDRIVITGTYAAADTLETGGAADASDGAPFIFGEFATVSGTTITVNTPGGAQATAGGTFFAIGRR